MNALELRDVTVEYPGPSPVTALKGVSVAVAHGEMVAVVGPSGSGKSTLLAVAGTLRRPGAGRVFVRGIDTTEITAPALTQLRRQRIGFVVQDAGLVEYMTARENVELGLLYRGLRSSTRRATAAHLLAAVGLDHRLDHEARLLSSGEAQRVALARALAGSPSLLLADEPTGNLDSFTAAGIIDLLRNLTVQGVSVVVATHDLSVVGGSSRTLQLVDGELLP